MRLKRVLSIPDLHLPFQDKKSVSLVLDVASQFKADEVILLGDVFDNYSISRYEKDPTRDFKLYIEELSEAKEYFHEILSKLKSKKIVFLFGNHDASRLERYVALNSPKLAGLLDPKQVFGIPERVLCLPYKQKSHYKIGKCIFTHGSRAGEHPTAAMVKRYGCSVIHGHTHKLQEHHISNINGQDFVGLSPGWLGDERHAAEYIHDVSNWSQGFCLTYHKANGDFYHSLVHIKSQGRFRSCVFNGKVYVK